MKIAIFSIMIGDDPTYQYARRAMEQYANKVNAKLIILTRNEYSLDEDGKKNLYSPAQMAWAQKLYLKQLLEEYDRVLYLDGDILITPHAPNIFVECPRLDVAYMLPEGLYVDRSKPVQQILSIFPLEKPWPKKQHKYLYYNAGVMLLSQKANPFKYATLSDLIKIYDSVDFYEQTYFNYLYVKHNITVEPLIPEYNRFDLFGDNEERLRAYFIHYAGQGYSSKHDCRYRTVIADYHLLYGEIDHSIIKYVKRQWFDLIYYRKKLCRLCSKIKKWGRHPVYYLSRKKPKVAK
jgi:lipopolysaccharide biosynthesis glycosyltransferase